MTEEPGRRRLPPWSVDALLGVGVGLTVSIVISADQGGGHGPDVLAYLWAVGLGALMFARRRYPVVVLAVTTLGLFAYYAADYPAVGLAVPVAAALFSAAQFGRLLPAIGTAVVVVVVSLVFRLLDGQDLSFVVGYELAGHILLMAAAIALGDSLRSRRAAQAGARRIAALTATRYQQEADARIHAERLAIARDLHDSVGHTTSVISLHADVARESLGRDDARTTAALDLIKSTATRMMGELRRTVALLRAPDENGRLVVSLSNIGTLRETVAAAGIGLDFDVRFDDTLPSTVDAAAFRIAQEAVTNVVKHSRARQARIAAHIDGDVLRISVTDDGPALGGDGETSHGIAGMRERAEALGGSLTARPESGGFAVRAVLPVERS